jgi:hypothetical protein
VNDESSKYYELLGVAPGTSGRELKQAYLDMAKVWHPDRFSHDPRLQQKAQERLKEINEAYELLKSGRAARHARPAPPPAGSYAPPAASARRGRAKDILAAACCAAFVVALYALTQTRAPNAPPRTAAERGNSRAVKEREQPDSVTGPPASQSARGNERAARRTSAEVTAAGKPGAEASAPPLRPMPTVAVNIDAATGMLATKDCPVVSRMSYPAGGEPRQFCTAPHDPKGSRVKSAAKRLVSPSRWFAGGKGTPNDEARDVRSPGGDGPQNR